MSLKSLIQWLLDSRTTPEQAGHSAMPNTGIRMTVADGASTIFTAPSDGYVYQFVNGSSNSSTYSICNNSTLGLQGQCNAGNGGQNRTFVPCRKGDEITCTRQGSPKTDVTIIFFATIGGGYLRHFVLDVCKRGELCRLKALSLCLPRSSLRANPNGSAVRHTLQGGLRSQPASPNMSLQRMGMLGSTKIKRPRAIASTFILTGLMGTSSQEKLWHSRITLMPLLSRASFLLRRATGLLFPVRSMRYGSRQRWEANSNLSTGGALC